MRERGREFMIEGDIATKIAGKSTITEGRERESEIGGRKQC